MTKKEAINLVNESLIDQDSKFTREIKALFKTQDVIDLMQQAYDLADDNAKASLMDATEKQFLDKFAKDGSGDDDEKENDGSEASDDFELDGSNLDSEEDGSEDDGSEDAGTEMLDNEETGTDDFEMGGDDSNPFADFGGGDEAVQSEPSNPFESFTPSYARHMNESAKSRRQTFRRR